MSLDLELNLGYESSLETHIDDEHSTNNSNSGYENYNWKTKTSGGNLNQKAKNCGGLTGSSSWVSFEVDHREMVAVVCMHCHMLVMLCKSSPSCPNCRFMHPLEQKPPSTTPSLSKSRFRLLCCKD
ncbi:hypothetical protein BVC80_715g35 [Macleaya cordata]|uniref:Uncharacterized protein n=1 Tax=Macleaya cordata TaxID=56857 RepID=A0A200PM95_MACCD|nr:hypothetical protein BVC80_715g35 [Macleaya cordata]